MNVNVTASVAQTASTPNDTYLGRLYGWIDFNRDGDFADAGEQVVNGLVMTGPYPQAVPITIPAGATPGATWARFRYSTQTGLSYTGQAYNGEVEDYAITLMPTLSINDVTQAEGNSGGPTSFVFTVTRAGDTSGPSTVHYTTVNGTAIGGIDYVTKSGTLTFITGDTEETIAVQVNGDWSYEANETFSVTLSSPTFAAISDGSGLGTITNDDIHPPSGLTATGVSMTQINLNWSDNSSDETAFYVERSPNGSTGWTEIGSVGANVTTYPDSTGLTCDTTYYYRVRAYRSSDTHYSIYTATANGKTTLCPPPPRRATHGDRGFRRADRSELDGQFHE